MAVRHHPPKKFYWACRLGGLRGHFSDRDARSIRWFKWTDGLQTDYDCSTLVAKEPLWSVACLPAGEQQEGVDARSPRALRPRGTGVRRAPGLALDT